MNALMFAICLNGEVDVSTLLMVPGWNTFTNIHSPRPSLKAAAKSPPGSLWPITSSTHAWAFIPAVASRAKRADGVVGKGIDMDRSQAWCLKGDFGALITDFSARGVQESEL